MIKDNSLYLITDSDLLYPGAISLEDHVEKAIIGGVDIVQLREKHADTGDFITKGKALLEVCRKHKVPLIINDRVDVALAIQADGVHVGQDDMPCTLVRQLMGSNCIIGVSVNNVEEAKKAVEDGADYLGIGAVYDTATKALTKPTMGVAGVQEILQYLGTIDRRVDTVAIGGINAANIDRVFHASEVNGRKLSGIALVSAIMTSSEPEKIARGLKKLMGTLSYIHKQSSKLIDDSARIYQYIGKVRRGSPLIQQMTNNVVKNFSANVTIAIGASPAMSEVIDEAEDFAKMNGALLLNLGMLSPETSIEAVRLNNKYGKPTLLDPVGAGASSFRHSKTQEFLNNAYFNVIKGNADEISAVSGRRGSQKGVDSSSTMTIDQRIDMAQRLARKWRNIVVVTGVEDVVASAGVTVVVRSGHPWLGQITGSGCSLGSTIASFLAVHKEDQVGAVVAA